MRRHWLSVLVAGVLLASVGLGFFGIESVPGFTEPKALDETSIASKPPPKPTRDPTPAKVPSFAADWAPEGMVAPPKPPKGAFDAPYIKGFAIGAHIELPGLPYDTLFKEIRALGATHVNLVVAWSQLNVRAVKIGPHEVETMPDAEVEALIGSAHANGLKVMLFPILHMERRRSGEWRGRIAPAVPDLWWSSYRQFIGHYAAMAQRTGVEVLSVGSELLDIEDQKARWEVVIKATREVYSGKLIYSANWDHFEGVTFWDSLDMAGMTGYFELSNKTDPPLVDLRQKWAEGSEVIAGYGEKIGRPIILTEVGYPSQVGTATHPWDYTRKKAASGEAQYMALRGMYEAYVDRAKEHGAHDTGLGGVFIWNWYGYGGPDDIGYTLRGKPATAIARRWFKGE